jgi:hypothetical protein
MAVLAFWVVLTAVSVVFTVAHLGFQTSQRSLISPNNRLMQLLDKVDRFSELEAFVVAIENRDTRRSLEFSRQLASRLEADHEHYTQVFYRIDPAGLRPWALLYLGTKDLTALRDNVREHASLIQDIARSPGLATFFEAINDQMAGHMVGELFTGFLNADDKAGKASPMDLGFLIRILSQMKNGVEGSSAFTSPWLSLFNLANEDEEGYFWTEGKKHLLIFLTPGKKNEGPALAALRETMAALKADFPDVSAGVTGQKALDEDEKALAFKDIRLATFLSLIGLAALLIIFWRGIRRALLTVAVLVIALCVTFGLTTLFIGHLNLLSVTFAPMLLGLGIDYAIHWFARYSEVRHSSATTGEALAATMDKVGPAILLAGLCASLSFFPLVLTGFKGLSELGLICAMGLAVTTAATLCLLPALIVLFDRFRIGLIRGAATDETRPLVKTTGHRAFFLVGLAVCASGLSLWGALKVRFDLNMLHLQSKSAESVVWENKLIEGSKHASIYGALFARSFQEIDEKTRALERLATVAEVSSIRDVLPKDQEHKILLLKEMKPLLDDIRSIPAPSGPVDVNRLNKVFSRIRFKMIDSSSPEWGAARPLQAQMQEVRRLIDAIRNDFDAIERPKLRGRLKRFETLMFIDLNDKLSLLYENMETKPLTIQDLPKALRDRFVGPDNLYLLRIFPAGNVWDPQFLATFVRDLRSVDPDVTGDPVTLSVFTKAFRDAVVKAALYAVVFIVIFLTITLRSPVSVLAALAPFVMGTLWTLGLMHVFAIDLNLANTIFMPLVVGAGVEYGIIVVQRWKQSRHPAAFSLPVSTGMGVVVAGLSTTVGFCSLMISRHQGIHSLGVLTTIGSLCVLGAAVLFLPALLYAAAHMRVKKETARIEAKKTTKPESKSPMKGDKEGL